MTSSTNNTFINDETQIRPGIVTNASLGSSAAIALSKLAVGTRGDILFFNGTSWASLAQNTAGKLLQTNGPNQDPSWVDPPSPSEWTLVETLTPNNAASINSTGDYSDADAIRAIGVVKMSAGNMVLQFNGDSGTNYYQMLINNSTVTQASSAFISLVYQTQKSIFELEFHPVSDGRVSVVANGAGISGANFVRTLGGDWVVAAATRVSALNFVGSGGNITGTIKIYKRTDLH